MSYGGACDLLVGQIVDRRYKIVRKVGEGVSAEVFYAEHVHLRKKVALKVLRPELSVDRESIERFQREAQIASEIGHPNIVSVEDFFYLDDGSFFLAMEWLDGQTLQARIHESLLDLDEAIAICAQICSGLEAAHSVSIIHRDLKPENVFLVDGPRGKAGLPTVKILDFGIAKFAETSDLTGAGVFLGTPHYVSPEQALAQPIDNRADIYSLGVMMYQMVTGSVPFDKERSLAVLRMHIDAEPTPPSQRAPERGISRDLERIILRCMEKEPDARFARASEVGEALLDLSPGTTPTLPGGPPPSRRRNPNDSDSRTLIRPKGTKLKLLPLDDAEVARSEFEEMSKTNRVQRLVRPAERPAKWTPEQRPEPDTAQPTPTPTLAPSPAPTQARSSVATSVVVMAVLALCISIFSAVYLLLG